MATITPTVTRKYDRRVVTWSAFSTADTAVAHVVDVPATRSAVQVTGTFGGATIVMQGSLDGTNFFNLTDAFGNALSITAAGGADMNTAVLHIRPSSSGGTGDDVTVTFVIRTREEI